MSKPRLAILIGEAVLGMICIVALKLGFEQVALAAVVGITALLPKLVESEEKTK